MAARSRCRECGGEVEQDGTHVSEWSPCVTPDEPARSFAELSDEAKLELIDDGAVI